MRQWIVHKRSTRKAAGKQSQEPELAQLIRRGNEEMKCYGANLWSVSPTKNHYWLHSFGVEMRNRAKKTGTFSEVTTRLGLAYGAFFGLKALHESRRYTRYGQVKDDVERTLRYWHSDGIVPRFARYAIVKDRCKMVGKFHARKGGISAGSSADEHQAEANRALAGMLKEFASKYARLAKPGETSSCGLFWRTEMDEGEDGSTNDSVDGVDTDAGRGANHNKRKSRAQTERVIKRRRGAADA